jgi:hypothetical protein
MFRETRIRIPVMIVYCQRHFSIHLDFGPRVLEESPTNKSQGMLDSEFGLPKFLRNNPVSENVLQLIRCCHALRHVPPS